jgi:hypothetical protein
MVCSVCSVDLAQMDEYGECPMDGAAYCPRCYAKHEDTCADCVPLEEYFDDDEGTDIGNGYTSESVSQTATQLSLF